MYKRARQSGLSQDWSQYYQIKKNFNSSAEKHIIIISIIWLAKGDKFQRNCGHLSKSQRNNHCGVTTLQENGIVFSDPQSNANLINKAFTTVFTSEDTSTMPVLDGTPYPEMPPIDINT